MKKLISILKPQVIDSFAYRGDIFLYSLSGVAHPLFYRQYCRMDQSGNSDTYGYFPDCNVKGIFDVYFRPNLFALSQAISRGELDYIITKPVNTLFFVSLKRYQFNQAGTALMGVGILVYAFQISPFSFGPSIFFQLVLMIIFGLVVFYSSVMAFSTLSIYVTRLSAISAYYDVLSNLLRYPTDALGYHTGLISGLLLPLTVVATLPAKLVLGKVPESQILTEAFLSGFIFALAYLFWSISLRRYSSASS